MRRIRTVLHVASALFLMLVNARAHDLFDCSIRMTIQTEQVETKVTLGMGAARQILAAGGLAEKEVADALRPRGPQATVSLPTALAAHFFELKNDEEQLSATALHGLSDGVEVTFTLDYPRPPAKTLNVRVNLYDDIPNLQSGSFVAHDERGELLGSALLSRASVLALVSLPEIQRQSVLASPNEESLGANSNRSETPASISIPATTDVPPSRGQFFKLGILVAFMAGVLASGYWMSKRIGFFK